MMGAQPTEFGQKTKISLSPKSKTAARSVIQPLCLWMETYVTIEITSALIRSSPLKEILVRSPVIDKIEQVLENTLC